MPIPLLRLFPGLFEAGEIRQVLNRNLSAENLQAEVRSLQAPINWAVPGRGQSASP
jgi:hypothetical protein